MSKIMIVGGITAVLMVLIAAIVLIVKKGNSKYEVITDETNIDNEFSGEKIKSKNIEKKNIISTLMDKHSMFEGEMINYNEYQMTIKEKIIWSAMGMAVLFVAAYVFYNNVAISALISLLGVFYPKIVKKDIIAKRKETLSMQFKEALYAISSSLSAGKSVPASFKDAYSDLSLIFENTKSAYILDELALINRRIDRNETVEDALIDLANRSSLEDIRTFSEIFSTCSKTGGNLKEVVQNTSKIMGDKIEIKQEISTLVSGKKFETKILTVMPFGILIFMRYTAPEFLEPLNTIPGAMIATLALGMILGATFLAKKITDIEV